MCKEKLAIIENEEKEYGDKINQGCKKEILDKFCASVFDKFHVHLPEEYINFLSVVNGIEFNGTIIYGVDQSFLSNEDINQDIYGFIDYNEIWNEIEWQKKYIFIGDYDIGWFVYDVEENKYSELDKPSGDFIQDYANFDEMIDSILTNAIGF